MAKKRYQDGGEVIEGPNENIGDDTRRRAMEAVRRRMAGETEEPTPAARPAPRPAPVARPAPRPAPSIEPPSPASMRDVPTPARPKAELDAEMPPPRSAQRATRALGDMFPNRSFPGKGPESSLPAIAGAALPAAARGVGKLASMLTPAGGRGRSAEEAEKADTLARTARREVAEDRSRRTADLVAQKRGAAAAQARNRSSRERSPEEEMMQGEGGRYAKGGSVSASRRADGAAQRGKTRGRIC